MAKTTSKRQPKTFTLTPDELDVLYDTLTGREEDVEEWVGEGDASKRFGDAFASLLLKIRALRPKGTRSWKEE